MKLSLPATLLVVALLCGCASHREDAAFKPVPGPSNPALPTAWDVVAAMPPAEVQPAPAAEEKTLPPPVLKDEPKKKSKPTKKPPEQIIVLPDLALSGKVVTFNGAGRFVVLHFPIGHMPATDTVMSVYRAGLKVGEIKVTGPQRDDNIVADLTAGEAQSGDEVRER